MRYYYLLEEGETIREGDEVEMSLRYNDQPKWKKATLIGSKAPNPHFISHRKYRRELTLDNYWKACSSEERARIVKKAFDYLEKARQMLNDKNNQIESLKLDLPKECVDGWDEVKFCKHRQGEGNLCKWCIA